MGDTIIIIAREKIQELTRKVHELNSFCKEEVAESYLLRYPSRNTKMANAYADKQLDPQIDSLKENIESYREFINKYIHLTELCKDQGEVLNTLSVSA